MNLDTLETIIEIAKFVVPPVLTLIATFLVTKYKYHKDGPKDKREVAYNRFYYPIYILVHEKYRKNHKDNYENIIAEIRPRLLKYRKYLNGSTVKSFTDFSTNKYKHKAYRNFVNNIYDHNSKLRRELGYLESNIFDIFKYGGNYNIGLLIVLIGTSSVYILIILNSICIQYHWDTKFLLKIIVFFLIIIVLGALLIIYEFIVRNVLLFIEYMKNKIKK